MLQEFLLFELAQTILLLVELLHYKTQHIHLALIYTTKISTDFERKGVDQKKMRLYSQLVEHF